MKNIKEVKVSYWAHHLTTIVSVTLVLLLAGIIALVWIAAGRETQRLKERVELSVVMRDSIPDGAAATLARKIEDSSYARNVRLISKQEALESWKRDTGEDLQELFGVNPMTEEIAFTVCADHASARGIAAIKASLEKNPAVEAVATPETEMLESMNRNIGRLTWILGIVAAIMLLISFVLINNTVHLTIYSRRFTIHTMQLVGATNAFIRRPVILNNMLAGIISGLIASALIAIAMGASQQTGMPHLPDYIGWWPGYAAVAAGLVATGMILCAIASWASANAYLRKDYDALFK